MPKGIGLIRALLAILLAAAAATATAAPASARGPTGVVADRSSIGGLRVGNSVARATRLWRRPDLTIRRGGVVSYRWRNDEGMLAYVRARAGRIFAIEVEGPVFRTPRGDGYGTRVAQFRRHWPAARRHSDCCATAVSHYAVRGLRRATVLVFTFRSGRLARVALTTESNFEACYVNECD
jgi:hypothetical protein